MLHLAAAFLAFVLLFVSSAAAAAAGRLRLDPVVDGALLAGGIGLSVGAAAIPDPTPLVGPTQDRPGGLDGLSPFRSDAGLLDASDWVLWGSMGVGFAASAWDGWNDDDMLVRAAILAEAFLITDGLTTGAKKLVLRPRPYTYESPSGGAGDQRSFFSGHASRTAAIAFASARMIDITADLGTWERIGLYGGATAVTAAVGALRVTGGVHFVSDVLVGGLVGAGVGIAVPELHRVRGVRFTPGTIPGGGFQIGATGRF